MQAMNSKQIARIVLLSVVAVAVGAWAMREFRSSTVEGTDGDLNSSAAFTRPDGVTVINFHGDKRCRTCIGIGKLAKQTVDEEFADEEKDDKVRWLQINYEEPSNAHFVKEYGLVSSTVVVTLWKDGKEVKWNRLDGVWDHFGDEPIFRAYVAQGVRELLNQP